MSVEAAVLHSTVVECLDSLDATEGEIVAAGIVVAFRDEGGKEWYRTICSRDSYFEQMGLLRAGLEVLDYEAEEDSGDD